MEIEKILIIQTAFLGDAILTLPMIQEISSLMPESNIDVLCLPGTKDVFENSPYVSATIAYDKRNKHKSIFSLFRLGRKIRRNKYTRIYSPHRSTRTTLLVFLSRVKETYGFNKASLSFLYKHKIKYVNSVHEVERNLILIDSVLRQEDWKILPEISIPSKAKDKVEQMLKLLKNEKLIAVAPGSVWATKVYPKEYFSEIIQSLVKQSYKVILLGGADDKKLCDEIKSKFPSSVYSAAGKLSIVESIQMIRQCKLLLCNDSAPTHMGMCADVPTLTIYASTIPGFGFYPYQKESRYISKDDLDCKPCGIHGHMKCPTGTFECAKNLSPQSVIDEIEKMLSKKEV